MPHTQPLTYFCSHCIYVADPIVSQTFRMLIVVDLAMVMPLKFKGRWLDSSLL